MRALALLALPLLVACGGPGSDDEPAPPVPAADPAPAPSPAPSKSSSKADPTTHAEETTAPGAPSTSAVVSKRDLHDVSPEAICAARANKASLGTFAADEAFGISSPLDLAAEVSVAKNLKGDVFNDLTLTFTYADMMKDGARYVPVGLWEISVKNAKDGVDQIVPGDAIDVFVVPMGKGDTLCTTGPGGGAFQFDGKPDTGKLAITERTRTSIEGTLERTMPDGTTAKLAFRAPVVDRSADATSKLDTTCCMTR